MCYDDGMLRAELDGELSRADAQEVESHLAACERCRARAGELAETAREVHALFESLAPAPSAVPAGASAAWARFQDRVEPAEPVRRSWWLLRPVWGVAAGVALVALMAGSPSTRALAQKLLGLLRVRAVVVVPVNIDVLSEGKGRLLGQVLSDSINVTKDEPSRVAASQQDATAVAGFTVRLPALRHDPPQLTILGARAFNLTVDIQRVQATLSLLGRPDLQVPEGLGGAKVVVDMPRSVRATYGNCPQPRRGPLPPGADYSDCVVVIQSPTPTVVTLPELNLEQIAVLGLQLAGMTPQQAEQFSRTVDWTSTLAIPLPRGQGESQNVQVNGAPGTLIVTREHDTRPAGYALIWIKDGVVYSVAGFGNPGLAVPLAESLS